ncbi:hypothetical protein MJO29_012789, partial [Puccinia striiformis f. sp. tritici]
TITLDGREKEQAVYFRNMSTPKDDTFTNPTTSITHHNTSQKMEDKAAQIRSHCPRSSKGSPCKGCQFTKDGKNWRLKCHCGKGESILLTNGQLQGAQRHWEGNVAKPVAKVQIQVAFCQDWAKIKIIDCVDSSPSTYHSGPPQDEICLRLFNTTQDSVLSKDKQKLLQDTINQEARWEIRHHNRHFPAKTNQKHTVCDEYLEVHKDGFLLSAINMKYTDADNIKFV